ncbi:MAG: hypothetical protein IKM99_08320 [Bacteroidales bacterium]|nr:hypothetical protein [Bacteroidales bacterium]
MKLRCFIGAFLFLALAACHHPVETRHGTSLPSELSAIDTLMQTRPDSALTLLLSCRDDVHTVSTADNHYYQLLLSEALYKNDYAQTNRDELLTAMAYFDSVQDPFLSARCHYMNGVGYYEMDSVVPACEEYLKALEIMEEHFNEEELVGYKAKFMALTLSHLCGLFDDRYFAEQVVYFGKRSLSYYHGYNAEPWHIAWVLEVISSNYDMMEYLDSACYYSQLAVEVLKDTNCVMYRDIEAHNALLSRKKGEANEVVIDRLYKILSQAESKNEYLARCFSMGGVYYYEQSYDSAWNYLNKVFEETERPDSKKQAAEWMVDICKAQSRDDEIIEFASFLIPFATQEENQSEIKSELTELYKDYSQKCLERQHHKQISRTMKWVLFVFVSVFLLLLLTTLLLHKTKKKEHDLKNRIEKERMGHEIKQKALSGRLKKSNEALRETLKRIEERETPSELMACGEVNPSLKSFEAFKQTAICQEVYNRVEQLHNNKRRVLKTDMDVADYKDFALSAKELILLSKTVEEHFPNLYSTLKVSFPFLSFKDWRFCLLYLLQLDKLSICVLLQENYQTCRRYTLK